MSSKPAVGIIFKHDNEPARKEAEKLEHWFRDRDMQVFSEEMETINSFYRYQKEASNIPGYVESIIVLGGDGTLLGAARKVGGYGIPILGVNLGGLGFLTGVPLERLYPVARMMLEGVLDVESRNMLEATVLRNDEEVCRFEVLNDIVINKGILARIIDLEVTINGEFLTTFRADGLIISTPTGSTAYNLAAHGPILYPTIETFTLTPICPFTLTNRPMILPDSSVAEIRMGKESEEKVMLTFDGQVGFDLSFGDHVIIRKADKKIRLFRPPGYSYFKILRKKLMWGGATHGEDGNC